MCDVEVDYDYEIEKRDKEIERLKNKELKVLKKIYKKVEEMIQVKFSNENDDIPFEVEIRYDSRYGTSLRYLKILE